jgi:phosphoribosylformylglycinamidine synthase
VAILREQGVNSHVETAWVMHKAGFDAIDVHMSDLIAGRANLADVKGLIAVGGFSYGDVLGAGEGWSKTILFNANLSSQFQAFFQRTDTFALGICNGCQMMSSLKSIIPGASHWPKFTRNQSEQFEARFAMIEVMESPSIFFAGMAGLRRRLRWLMVRALPIFQRRVCRAMFWCQRALLTMLAQSLSAIPTIPMARRRALPQ